MHTVTHHRPDPAAPPSRAEVEQLLRGANVRIESLGFRFIEHWIDEGKTAQEILAIALGTDFPRMK